MTTQSEMSKCLMREEGVMPEGAPSAELEALREKVKWEERALKRLRIVGFATWPTITAVFTLVWTFLNGRRFGGFGAAWMEGVTVGTIISFYIVLTLVVIYFVRLHLLNQHKMQATLLRMEAQLASAKAAPTETHPS